MTARGLHRIVLLLPDDDYQATIHRYTDGLLYEETVPLEKLDDGKYLLEYVDRSHEDGLLVAEIKNSSGAIAALHTIGVSRISTDVLWLSGNADIYGIRYPLAKDAFIILEHEDLHYLIRRKLRGNRFREVT